MNRQFSLQYGETAYRFSANESTSYQLDAGVSVRVEAKTYAAYDAEEWVLWFENTSETDSKIFSEINDCDTLLPLEFSPMKRPGYRNEPGDACVIAMNGMIRGSCYNYDDPLSATEYSFHRNYLDKLSNQACRIENTGGRSSEGMMPFFDVTAKESGYLVAIGWTGDWRADFAKREDGIHVTTGLKYTGFYLKPGERIRTSSVLLMKYGEGEDKHNKFRRLIKAHFSHKSNTQAHRESLMAFELWGGLPSEEMKKRISELKAHDIRFEDIWIDAGWYGECEKCDDPFSGDWSVNTGNWSINSRTHPRMLTDVRDCAKDAGMRLMLWLEPERAIKGTPVTQEHPDWFLYTNSRSHILNYGNEEALAYTHSLLRGFIKELDLSCYRQDFNTRLTEYFQNGDEENRRGITEIKHVMGLYALWDALLEEFPHLLIDNCSSGGRRIDIETLKRSIPFFRSDYQCNFNENSEVLQAHNANASAYLPYNGCTSKTKSDTYAARSSYSSSWGGAFYNAVFQRMDEADFAWAKKITDEYRSIRRYFSMDFYNHGSCVYDETSWAIWQYHDPESQSGILMAFRRGESPFDRVTVSLKGLLADRSYQVRSLDDNSQQVIDGTLTVHLPEKRLSTILVYQLA